MNRERDITFDIMKGIGILLVITCHFFGWNHPLLANSINSFHMPMFFIVAGFFSKTYTNWKSALGQIWNYIKRLWEPFCFIQILIVLWGLFLVVAQQGDINSVISDFLSIFWADVYGPTTSFGKLSIGVTWFLMALLVAKIILLPLTRTGGWAIPISLVLAYGTILLHDIFPYSIWCISLGITALPFVTIGWWVKNHKIPLWVKIFITALWPVAIIFAKLDMFEFLWECYILNTLGACGGTYCLFLLCKFFATKTHITAKALASLGLWSLAIMCFHHFEMETHMTDHILALIPFSFSIGVKYIFRYIITIGMAVLAMHTPLIKKIF